jgi:lipopolysaccharide/colanic/teichoic acid biosynthesis glycosyltransferase
MGKMHINKTVVTPFRGRSRNKETQLLFFFPNSARSIIKDGMDVILSFILLLATMPLFLLISVAVSADGGPVFYSQRRVGRRGIEFDCLKFRSMQLNSQELLVDYLRRNDAAREEWAATRKLKHDPRLTSIGKILRRTSLDELPQLINVLRGEMSLVGPRPVLWSELEVFYKRADAVVHYLAVRPGLTGPWQVGGRSDLGYDERVALDSTYVQNPSLRRDFIILFKTLGVVIRCRGAY